jgi:hypothetical protein
MCKLKEKEVSPFVSSHCVYFIQQCDAHSIS